MYAKFVRHQFRNILCRLFEMLMYGFISFIYVDAKFMLSLSEAISFCHETDAKSYDILNHGQWVYNVRKSFRIVVLVL